MEHDVALVTIIKSILKEMILDVDSSMYHGEQVDIQTLTNEGASNIIDAVFPDGCDMDIDDILEEADRAINHARYVELSGDLERIIWEETWTTLQLQGQDPNLSPGETPSSYDFVKERTKRTMDRIKRAQQRGHGFVDI